MGVDSKKAPPLPAPTETESTVTTQTTELAADADKPADDKSSYSLPEDGTPVTIKTRGHKSSHSQTSLLIEYFEGGKASSASGSTSKPSVRVRLTPSKNRRNNDHIQITETKSASSRKASLARRQSPLTPTPAPDKSDEALSLISGDHEHEDAKSMNSYASATEESNVSRNPIEVDIDRSGGRQRRRRPASPLIPTADGSKAFYQPGDMSDISAIPTDSFLDGSGPSQKSAEARREKSPSRTSDALTGAAAGLGAAVVADKAFSKSRTELKEKDRSVVSSKTRDRDRDRDRSERRHKAKSRTSSITEQYLEGTKSKSGRRKSNKGNEEPALSGADSSVLSSAVTPSHRSFDTSSMRSGASKSSINNPKLLETVEDAIKRLILPELNAIKREQSKREARRSSVSSGTTTSTRDDHASDRRQSGGDKYSTKSRESLTKTKERRDREARHDLTESPAPVADHESIDESAHEIETTPHRGSDKSKVAAAGASLGATAAAALNGKSSPAERSPAVAREQRRRRRAEANRRNPGHTEEHDELQPPAPPMPLMSDINTSDMTRTSILSADTDRPHSASEELTPVQEVARGIFSAESNSLGSSSSTPTRAPVTLQNSLGTQHANISHGDLKALPQRRAEGGFDDDYEADYNEGDPRSPEGFEDEQLDQEEYDDYYNTQDVQEVPPPLKYVPYLPERRGLSPIPSVSGYTEGGSEVHNRDSRVSHRTSGSYSSPDKSPRHGMESPSVLSRESYQDDRSDLRSSGLDYRNTTYTDDSELDRVTSGQAVRAVGANPNLIHTPVGVESHVASLVESSQLDESVLAGESSRLSGPNYDQRESMDTLPEESSRFQASNASVENHRQTHDETTSRASDRPESQRSHEMDEYELDEYGRKVTQTTYRQSPTASEAAITGAAVGAAAAALRAAQVKRKPVAGIEEQTGDGVQRNKSFKDRTRNGFRPEANTPSHSVDRLVTEDHDMAKTGFSGLPDLSDPMPEIGYGYGTDDDLRTNPSRQSDRLSASREATRELWHGAATPTQESVHREQSGRPLTLDEAAGAAAIATASAMAHQHSREPSGDHEDEWRRTSEERKRDTIVTNPYEGTSPIANLPGLDQGVGQAPTFDPHGYVTDYGTRSPIGHAVDEGYISQGPKKTPDLQDKGKDIDFDQAPKTGDDPFYSPNAKHLSGLSQGMETPLYDAATGAGLERIESKDIIALMQHLMVRDAQRSARDTEILVTLVRTAAEMRNSFDDIKRMLADTEDVIITEVKDNTEKTVQRHIGGPRPYPGSTTRSIQTGGSQAGTDHEKKTRNLWRRALKGLSAKGTNDLTRIEDMLMQLLGEVDVLKAQTAPGGISQSGPSFDNIQPEVQYEQDHGYEPEGNAGTSTASHASQSGHLSIPRNASGKLGYERKVSGHRISTVPEDEEEYQYREDPNVVIHNRSNTDMLSEGQQPSGSMDAGTPPQQAVPAQASAENTPRTDKGKKHKSSGSSSWFPKISRWSETTASSVGRAFRKSKDTDASSFHAPPSRSGSSLAAYDYPVVDPYGEDKLHTGFSEDDLSRQEDPNQIHNDMAFTMAGVSKSPLPSQGLVQAQTPSQAQQDYPLNYQTPEDPKYTAHRNSLNLQHPRPRPGQTEKFRTQLEHSAEEFDSPMSPKSGDWGGSATSLTRFPGTAPIGYREDTTAGDEYWMSSPAAAASSSQGPPRPPKEPLDNARTPAKSNRISKLAKSSPLPYQSVESGYGTATQGAPSYSGSPKPENRNLSNALSVPTRRPSGPRAMGSKSPVPSTGSNGKTAPEDDARRRKRDTFGTVASSQDTDTF